MSLVIQDPPPERRARRGLNVIALVIIAGVLAATISYAVRHPAGNPFVDDLQHELENLRSRTGVTRVLGLILQRDGITVFDEQGGAWGIDGINPPRRDPHPGGVLEGSEPFDLSLVTATSYGQVVSALGSPGGRHIHVRVVQLADSGAPIYSLGTGPYAGARMDLTPIRWDASSADGRRAMLAALRPHCAGAVTQIQITSAGKAMCDAETASFGLEQGRPAHRSPRPPTTRSYPAYDYDELAPERLDAALAEARRLVGAPDDVAWEVLSLRRPGSSDLVITVGSGAGERLVGCSLGGTCKVVR